jgi:hypothetical protein
MDIKERVYDEHEVKKHCCSQAVMNMALEDMGRDEAERLEMVKAMGAYCGGMHEGLACGALCGAKSALFIAEEDIGKSHEELGPELMGWFKERFGAWNCSELLEGDLDRRFTLCPVIMADTYLKLYDMLEDIGAV